MARKVLGLVPNSKQTNKQKLSEQQLQRNHNSFEHKLIVMYHLPTFWRMVDHTYDYNKGEKFLSLTIPYSCVCGDTDVNKPV